MVNQVDTSTPRNWIEASWQWPEEILELFEELERACNRDEILAVVLTGSSARGELAIERGTEGLMMRSDVEFYVLAEDPARARSALEPLLFAIEARYQELWPGFHMDASYMKPRRFEQLEPWIRHFELKANGKIVAGIDCLDLVPPVTLDDLDWRELNEVILWRMLGTVVRLPCDWLRGVRSLTLEERHALARSLLDVTTWACPGFGVLLPSFGARVDWWQHEGPPAGEESRLPSGELLTACLLARGDSGALPEAEELFQVVCSTWDTAFRIATGTAASLHRGAGLGFRRVDVLRRCRAAARVAGSGMNSVVPTLRGGPFRVAAQAAHALLVASARLHSGESAAPALSDTSPLGTVHTVVGEIDTWNTLRVRLARYMDCALGRPEWSRFLPQEPRA